MLGPLPWALLLALALLEGNAGGFLSLALVAGHLRLLVVIPLLFLCEAVLDPQLRGFSREIVRVMRPRTVETTIGGGEPVLPGVSIGHNEHGAWGLTIFGNDNEDLYVYETNPANPNEYRYRGGWEAMRFFTEPRNVCIAYGGPP